jgi:hypothetical protein
MASGQCYVANKTFDIGEERRGTAWIIRHRREKKYAVHAVPFSLLALPLADFSTNQEIWACASQSQ